MIAAPSNYAIWIHHPQSTARSMRGTVTLP
jgi:hypothetical protein